jgi:tRNA(Ile)-lysidine synthase
MAASRNKKSSNLPVHVAAFLAAAVPSNQTLCVGLSGGRDSIVLLHALAELQCLGPLQALHVHHGLSANADSWAEHCRSVCSALNIPLTIRRVAVPSDTGLGLEAAARAMRYAAFSEVQADCILLAHHLDDQAETVLFNLLRGCGVAGAKGMSAERKAGSIRVLRPLLDITADQIAAYAVEHGLVWIEDESNHNTNFSRNYLRREVMPKLTQRFPSAAEQLHKAAGHFAEAEFLLAELAEIDWQRCAEGDALNLSAVRALSAPRIRNLLRWRLQGLGWRVPAALRLDEFVRQLCDAGPEGRPQLALPDGEMEVRRRQLHFLPAVLT